MDPNVDLFYALQAAERIIGCMEDSVPIDDEDALRLAECVLNLDEFLSKKGFLPKKWER